MRSTTLTEAQKEAKVGALMAKMDSGTAAIFVNSLLVTGGTTANGAALSNALSNTLVAIAKSSTNVALQGAIGLGMGRAAATMSAAGYVSASAGISGAANASGLTTLTKGLTTGIQQGNNTAIFTLVISPSQACKPSC